jgi:hypothetical protein
MGQFSYVCTKCGKKDQFDWMTGCVVKIGSVHVKGTYGGYAHVKVAVEGKDKPVLAAPIAPIDNVLLSSAIYCNGSDPKSAEKDLLKKMLQQQERAIHSLMAGGGVAGFSLPPSDEDEPELRFCVPKDIVVLDELSEDLLAKMPMCKKTDTKKRNTKRKTTKDDTEKKADEGASVAKLKKTPSDSM